MIKEEESEKPKLSRNLIAFSFLAQATKDDNDLISGLTPIFKPIAKLKAGNVFDPEEFSSLLNELYGLKVHPWAVQELIPRMVQADLLLCTSERDGIVQYIYAEINEDFDEITEADIRDVIHQFISFSVPILDGLGYEVNKLELENGFLNQLIDMDFISIMLKPDRTVEDKKSKSTLSLRKDPEVEDWEKKISKDSKFEVLSAAFIIDAYHKNQALYDLLMRITTGALLSEVVLNIQDPGKTVSLKGLFVVLDTSFLMSYMDLTSEEAHIAATEICDLLVVNGAELLVYDHTIDEIKDNLRAVIEQTKNGNGHRATARRMAAASSYRTFVSQALSNLDVLIQQRGIKKRVPPLNAQAYAFFTAKDEDDFESFLGFGKQLVRERDAKSIAATVRLRRGHLSIKGHIHDSRYIFITENTKLVSNSQRFLKQRNLADYSAVPPAITEKYLAGLLWVLYGGKGAEITRHLLLANCARALEPRNDVAAQMHKFLVGIDSSKAEFFEKLMTEERAAQYLMQLTLGDSALLTKGNVEDVLEQVKLSLVEKMDIHQREEIQKLQDAQNLELATRERRIAELRDEVLESNTGQLELKEQIRSLGDAVEKSSSAIAVMTQQFQASQDALDEKNKNLLAKISRKSKSYRGMLEVLFSALLALILLYISLNINTDSLSSTQNYIYWAISIIIILTSTWKLPDYIFSPIIDKLVLYYEYRLANLFDVREHLEDHKSNK